MTLVTNRFKPQPNSLKNTFCVFIEKEISEIQSLELSYSSDSGSTYYYNEIGMYRYSNHWGRLANSKWRLLDKGLSATKYKLGFAKWEEFYPDNDVEKLYYLEWNRITNEINYQHKNNPLFSGKEVLRTSLATQKRLKVARNILQLHNWAKYYDEDIEVLREKVLDQLIYTDLPLEAIKSKLI